MVCLDCGRGAFERNAFDDIRIKGALGEKGRLDAKLFAQLFRFLLKYLHKRVADDNSLSLGVLYAGKSFKKNVRSINGAQVDVEAVSECMLYFFPFPFT